MKLLDQILLDKIDWTNLSNNPNAINLLEQPLAPLKVLEQNIDKIN